MKRIMTVVCVALLGATVFAGSSGVSNPVRKDHQPGFGDSSLQAKVVEFADDVVASLDSLTTADVTKASTSIVIVPTNATYTVLAANSGKTHVIGDQACDTTINLPAEAAGLYYKFIYVGAAADAQDWIITSGATANYFVGGVAQSDPGGVGTNTVTSRYSDGNSNNKLGVLTPASGTYVELWCATGVYWHVNGWVVSATDAGVTFTD